MHSNCQNIYLPIRALGDFIISAAVVKNRFIDKIPILLPPYLIEIYNSINADNYFDKIGNVDFFDQPAFFELYKVTDITNLKRLLIDIKKIYSITNDQNTYLLDYSSKRLSFVKAKLDWPAVTENIYDAKFNMFAKYYEVKPTSGLDTISLNFTASSKVLIIPGSRIAVKRINNDLIEKITKNFTTHQIDVAEFKSQKVKGKRLLWYSNFDELINLIKNYDLIISAESLPYHLAYYFNKPHFVVYNKSKHFKQTFMTPFMIKNNFYSTCSKSNNDEVINRLQQIFSKANQLPV